MANILIVDTQPVLRHQLAVLLEQAGHQVTAVATVAEASRIVQGSALDLVATDVNLLDGSSAQLVRQAAMAGIKTLMMTGDPKRIIDFDGAGQPYLSKPFPPGLFVKRVEELLSGLDQRGFGNDEPS
jgi:DNA-binding response OmpR family regulator